MGAAEARALVDRSRSYFVGHEHHRERPTTTPTADVHDLVDLYDGEIRAAGEGVGAFMDALAAQGLLENTLVVVTADHGEEFLDHQGLGHGQTLHHEVLHVPLMLRVPGDERPSTRDARTVQQVDIAPTILSLAGVSTAVAFDGRPLFSHRDDEDRQRDDASRHLATWPPPMCPPQRIPARRYGRRLWPEHVTERPPSVTIGTH